MASAFAYLAQARRTLEDAGLGGEFHYDGELDRAGKLRFLRNLDVLNAALSKAATAGVKSPATEKGEAAKKELLEELAPGWHYRLRVENVRTEPIETCEFGRQPKITTRRLQTLHQVAGSHEQHAPDRLLSHVRAAEAAGDQLGRL